jgi:hypothetical protein
MPFTFSLPNPLSRLTTLIEAVEHARSAAAAAVEAANLSRGNRAVDEAAARHAAEDQLDCLSLSRHGDALEPGSHELEAMSLSRVERSRHCHPED